MPDSHEEQLLSDLLSAIAREDARLDAAHLEPRVIAAAEAKTPVTVRLKADPTYARVGVYLRAAAIVFAVLVPGFVWMMSARPTDGVTNQSSSTTAPILSTPTTPTTLSTPTTLPTPTTLRTLPTLPTLPTSTTLPTPTTLSTLSTPPPPVLSADDFVPLLPLTGQELTGSFQLVRVQMPRASLGTLRSPLERPDELVEADVLLGADGMARAIRVSTSGSVYPWRTR